MPLGRRFFMVGAGALITGHFVSRAVAHAKRTSRPFLVTPDRIEEELFVYDDGRISLGRYSPVATEPVPTWREYVAEQSGRPIETISDAIAAGYDLTEEELDRRLDPFGWEQIWQCQRSPTARAYKLLDGMDLGALRHRTRYTRKQNSLLFTESFHPLDASHVVFAEDEDHPETVDLVTVSLLQARLVELGTGLRLVRTEYE